MLWGLLYLTNVKDCLLKIFVGGYILYRESNIQIYRKQILNFNKTVHYYCYKYFKIFGSVFCWKFLMTIQNTAFANSTHALFFWCTVFPILVLYCNPKFLLNLRRLWFHSFELALFFLLPRKFKPISFSVMISESTPVPDSFSASVFSNKSSENTK